MCIAPRSPERFSRADRLIGSRKPGGDAGGADDGLSAEGIFGIGDVRDRFALVKELQWGGIFCVEDSVERFFFFFFFTLNYIKN